MLYPKTRRIKSRKHQQFISNLRCLLDGEGCSANVQAHHLLRPWYGARGVGMRASDNNTVPLCSYHHRQLHDFGDEDTFWTQFGHDANFGREQAERLWQIFEDNHNARKR